MAEPHEVEGSEPGQLLVPRLDVDGRIAIRPALVVEVSPVDIHPDASERIDELAEAAEVDRHQVVDPDAGEPPNRLERALRAALRVGGVDLVRPRPLPGQTISTRMSRGNESIEIVSLSGSAQTSISVSEREGVFFSLVDPVVVPDHERGRRLARQRRVERLATRPSRRSTWGRAPSRSRGRRVAAAQHARDEDGKDDHRPAEHARPRTTGARNRLRLPVHGDRGERRRAKSRSHPLR